MNAGSVLFRAESELAPETSRTAPEHFRDLNLDQVVAAVTRGKEEYDLAPFFLAPLDDIDAIAFRHEVMHDLEDTGLLDGIKAFAQSMRSVREHLARLKEGSGDRQQERWCLDAVCIYADAVGRLAGDLSAANCASRGLRAFRDHLAQYIASDPFTSLVDEAKRLAAALASIRYGILIRGSRVEVHRAIESPDYSAEVEAAFARFRQRSASEYAFRFRDTAKMNHVEAQILDGVARLHPETFSQLRHFHESRSDFLDGAILAFDREIQFYVAYLDHIAPLKKAGLDFCYPQISGSREGFYGKRSFDVALAGKLIGENATPVCNDFRLEGPERIIVVSGPNQGGKTTFARAFGQLHYLASLGCPVPGSEARLYLCDRIFTHFEREEHAASLRGKLEDDIVRIHAILQSATPRSIIIVNEIFTSTALRDALFLSKEIVSAIADLDALCVWVTFLVEMASLNRKTVSMVSMVAPDNPAHRTFKITRQAADGLAYAMSLAEKYRLTEAAIRERIGS